jgi:hypothetical protein
MRTTIRMDDDLLTAAKVRAAADGITLTRLIEDAVRESLARRAAESTGPFTLEPVGDAKTLPGVELDDSAGLRDVMDGLR